MSNWTNELYAKLSETPVYESETSNRLVNKILMGTWVGVVQDDGGSRIRVITAGPDGWVERDHLKADLDLKIFFVDVGQGDGALVEANNKRLLIDGGPNSNLLRYLRGYQFRYILEKNEKVFIDTMIISHFDADHYNGLIAILNDPSFEFGQIFHNGIARFSSRKSNRPDGYNQDLGRVSDGVLRTTFNDMDDVEELLAQGGLQMTFRRFLEAVKSAHESNRLQSIRRLTSRNKFVPGYPASEKFSIEILGPVPRLDSGRIDFPWFSDSSHTRNGHSLVLKLSYTHDDENQKTFLLGGDLNTQSENYLMEKHQDGENPFQVDVAKSCHHGSGDFSIEFMEKLSPFATVISSGDNESHAHPRADAVGCAGKYSRGVKPLVFSTELARSINSGGDVLYGMINCRTDGKNIVMAQMKESRRGADIWDSYDI